MNSSSGSWPSPGIDRHGCRRGQLLVAAVSALATVALLIAGLPATMTVSGAVVIALAGGRAFRGAVPGVAGRLLFLADGQVQLDGAVAGPIPAALERSWRLGTLMAGLALRPAAGGRVTVLLFRDQMEPGAWRRLLVRLRHAG